MTAASNTMPAGTMSGTPQVLLAHHLKQLKLPTVLREYRLKQSKRRRRTDGAEQNQATEIVDPGTGEITTA